MLEPTAATFSKDRTERALVADEDDRQVPTYLPRYPVLSLVWLAITADIVTAVVRTRQEHATEYSIFTISAVCLFLCCLYAALVRILLTLPAVGTPRVQITCTGCTALSASASPSFSWVDFETILRVFP